ncbi:MAG TPA: hypothetical protein VJ553_01925 [Candidatus Paceibacterota bacterium]|nr:hypothetical protein [Candidatus Paceibacterota bacterium]
MSDYICGFCGGIEGGWDGIPIASPPFFFPRRINHHTNATTTTAATT